MRRRQNKRKLQCHGKKSSSTRSPKQIRQGDGGTLTPLVRGVFGTELRLGDKIYFNLNGAEKITVQGHISIRGC